MTRLIFQLADSLEKVLPDREPTRREDAPLRGFSGETLSLQLAYTCENDDLGESDHSFRLAVAQPEGVPVTVRRVELVPCAYPCHGTWDDNYLDTRPGLYPDLLRPMEPGEAIKAVPGQWRALWLDIDAPPGRHNVTLRVEDTAGAVLWSQALTVEVMAQALPPQELIHTQWFHADCLADYYRVDVFSEEHWRIIANFMAAAVRHGINMLLTPVFTPPLDTAKGGERTTVQLVGVQKHGDDYAFDFTKLDRWIGLCEKSGIRYLEISHLFTQWGAICAPKIMGSVDGGPEEKLFGWHTPAVGGEYTRFLGQFLPTLREHLARAGWLDRTFFHISDEPHIQEAETYAVARASVKDLLEGCRVIDALSSYDVYKLGLVEHPIVSVDHIGTFLQAGVPHLWAYYCTAQAVDTPNRFIAMPSARSRIMGVLLYYHGIEGFLHWGFNFYNSQCSVEHIDPFRVTDAGEAFPSGDPFLVYPAPDGTAWDSIRGMVIRQSLNDLRALKLLEGKIGRPAVRAMLEELAGGELTFTRYPRDSAFFETVRSNIRKNTTMELEIRKLSPEDGRDVYGLLQILPADENGFMNPANGLSYDKYRDWLRFATSRSEQTGIIDGVVPETIFWLYEDGKPVGMGKVRHLMTEALLEKGGNIGYAILPSARGRGLGKKLLALLVAESKQLHAGRLLLTIQNHNQPSIRVALANGGRLERVTADRHYIWIDPQAALSD